MKIASRLIHQIALAFALLVISMTAAPSAMAACSDPRATYVDWSGCDKKDAKLAGVVLAYANLEGANLSGADLTSASLLAANLKGSDLTGADLVGAKLGTADLTDAVLLNANLRGANLRGANLTGAQLNGADLRQSDLRQTDLGQAELAGADMSGARVSNVSICAKRSIGRCREERKNVNPNATAQNANPYGAHSADTYEVHTQGQFAGVEGYELLAISDRMIAEGKAGEAEGDWDGAYGAYNIATKMRQMIYQETHPDQFDALHLEAQAAIQAGWFSYSVSNFEEALKYRTELLGPGHPDALLSLAGYAGVQIEMGLPERALSTLNPAIERSESELGVDHPVTMDLLQQYGRANMELRKNKEAEWIFALVLAERERLNPEDDVGIANAASDLAEALASMRKYEDALTQAKRAVEILVGRIDVRPTDLARAQAAYGKALLGLGDYERSEVRFRSAMEEIAKIVGMKGLSLGQRIITNLAKSLLRQPEKRQLALEPLLSISVDSDDIEAVRQAPKQEREVHRLLLDAYFAKLEVQGGHQMTASELASLMEGRFKSMRQSFDNSADLAILSAIGRNTPGESGELVREREKLLGEKSDLQPRYAVAQGTGDIEAAKKLKTALIFNRSAIMSSESAIKKVFPEYFDFLEPETMDIRTPNDLLKPGEALLMIVPTELSTQVLYFANGRHRWKHTSATPDEIAAAVRRLLWDVGAPNDASQAEINGWMAELEDEGAYPYSFTQAKFLYGQLYTGLELDGIEHIFVVADGPIAGLPQGLLVSDIPKGRSGDPGTLRHAKWLSDRFSFSVLPSLQTLSFLRKHRPSVDGANLSEFIGIGDPALEGQAYRRGSSSGRRGKSTFRKRSPKIFRSGAATEGSVEVDLATLRSMARLPGTAEELTNLWQTFGEPEESLFLREKATETIVKSRALDAHVVAFATHGLLAGEIEGTVEPGLVLTPPVRTSSEDNGYLASSEIATLDMNANWVILSACNTASSDGSVDSSSLSGLARSFFFAGAQSLLASHWPVRDDVAARLTVRTVELTRGDSPLTRSAALRQAMKEVRVDPSADSADDTWAHPNAWAPFSMVGDGSAW